MNDNSTSTLTSVNAEDIFEPFDIGRVPWVESTRGERFALRYQHLSTFGGGSQISVSMEILPPGKQANQAHFHMLEEEHVFILEGRVTLQLGEKSYQMTAGHYVCFPAGQKVGHALISRTSEPCRYLVFGNPHPHDVAVHTDTGRVSVKLAGESYRKSRVWMSMTSPDASIEDAAMTAPLVESTGDFPRHA